MMRVFYLGLLAWYAMDAFADLYTAQEQSWQGQSAQLVRQKLGKPDQIIHQTDGNSYYLYELGNKYMPPSGFPGVGINFGPYGKVVIAAPAAHSVSPKINLQRCYVTFVLNQKDHVIAAHMEGSDCGDKVP